MSCYLGELDGGKKNWGRTLLSDENEFRILRQGWTEAWGIVTRDAAQPGNRSRLFCGGIAFSDFHPLLPVLASKNFLLASHISSNRKALLLSTTIEQVNEKKHYPHFSDTNVGHFQQGEAVLWCCFITREKKKNNTVV